MTKPEIDGAKAWALNYVGDLKDRLPELSGPTAAHKYDLEMLKIVNGVDDVGGCYEVPLISGGYLLDRSGNDPIAFDLMREIIATNRRAGCDIPGSWRDFEEQNTLGKAKRPSRRGPTRKHALRDLVFKYMAEYICDNFRLDLATGEKKPGRVKTVSACDLISVAFRAAGEWTPSPRSIEKAIRRSN